MVDGVICLRNVCNQRLKFEVEYGLKRGTTDNTYVVTVRSMHSTTRMHSQHRTPTASLSRS